MYVSVLIWIVPAAVVKRLRTAHADNDIIFAYVYTRNVTYVFYQVTIQEFQVLCHKFYMGGAYFTQPTPSLWPQARCGNGMYILHIMIMCAMLVGLLSPSVYVCVYVTVCSTVYIPSVTGSVSVLRSSVQIRFLVLVLL